MKLLVTGPVTADAPGPVTAAVLSFLETKDGIDTYLYPTRLEPPISPFAATLMGKMLQAPFDALLAIHDTQHIHTSIEAYKSSTVRIAYVTHRATPTWNHDLAKRLSPFGYVIARNRKAADAIESELGRRPLIATPAEVVEMLRDIPSGPIVPSTPTDKWPAIHEALTSTGTRHDHEPYSLTEAEAYFRSQQ